MSRNTFDNTVVETVERNNPFAQLGANTNGLMTASECMAKAGLDWKVDTLPCFVQMPSGEFVEVPHNKIPVRSDNATPFKAVGNRYVPFQNHEVFSFMDNVVSSVGASYENAGTFERGALVYITIKLGDEIKIADDKVVPYFTVINSHNGSTSIKAITTPIRITCSNTLQLAVKNSASSFSFRHTFNAKSKVAQARNSLEIGFQYYDEFGKELNKFAETSANVDDLKKMLDVVFPVVSERTDIKGNILNEGAITKVKLAHNKIVENFEKADSYSVVNNAWGMLNAINDWELWTAEIRGADRFERQAKTSVSGRIHPITDKAFAYINENLINA
jgi:phage/plasmid-like protein (TIGR03299 family)